MLHHWGNGSHEDGDRQIGVDRYSACKSRTWTESPWLVYVMRSNSISNRRSQQTKIDKSPSCGCFLLPKHGDDELGTDLGALKFATTTSSVGRCIQQFSGGDVDRFAQALPGFLQIATTRQQWNRTARLKVRIAGTSGDRRCDLGQE